MQVPFGDPNAKSALGIRYDQIGHSTVPLRNEQLEVRDRLLRKLSSGVYQLEDFGCLCGRQSGDNDITLATVDQYGLPNRVVICTNCGLVRADPRMNEEAYTDFYQNIYRKLYAKIEGGAQETFEWFVSRQGSVLAEWLSNLLELSGKKVIEIGCGGGWNLVALKQKGCTVVGYDYDESFLEVGRNCGLTLHQGGIQEALKTGQFYDLIILSHIVEHFSHPMRELIDVKRLLKPDGMAYVEVPGLLRKHTEQQDLMFYWQNAHTYYFTLVTLSNLMTECGYRMVMGDEFIHSLWQMSSEEEVHYPWKANPGFARFLLNHLIQCEARRQATIEQRRQVDTIRGWRKVARQVKRFLNRWKMH